MVKQLNTKGTKENTKSTMLMLFTLLEFVRTKIYRIKEFTEFTVISLAGLYE